VRGSAPLLEAYPAPVLILCHLGLRAAGWRARGVACALLCEAGAGSALPAGAARIALAANASSSGSLSAWRPLSPAQSLRAGRAAQSPPTAPQPPRAARASCRGAHHELGVLCVARRVAVLPALEVGAQVGHGLLARRQLGALKVVGGLAALGLYEEAQLVWGRRGCGRCKQGAGGCLEAHAANARSSRPAAGA
jgi:hypothetical protein